MKLHHAYTSRLRVLNDWEIFGFWENLAVMKWAFELKFSAAGFWGAVLILCGVSGGGYWTTTQLFERQKQVEYSYEVLQKVKEVLTTLRDAERARRGYVITGKDSYLSTYETSVETIKDKFDEVRILTANSRTQQHRLDLIEPLIALRVDLIKQSIALYKKNPEDRAIQIELTDLGIRQHDAIWRVIAEMEGEEQLILQKRIAESQETFRYKMLLDVVGHGLSFSLLFAVYSLLHQQIQKRRQFEETLSESEQRYRSLFELNPHPLWVYDQETLEFLAVNEAAIQHYGYSRAEFLSLRLCDIVAGDKPYLFPFMQGIRKHIKQDETVIDVEVIAHDLMFKGRPATLVLARDITEENKAQEALRVSEEKFRQIAENIHEVFWMSDLKLTKILYVNSAYEQIWGRSCESLYKNVLSFLDVVHPEDRESVMTNMLKNREKSIEIEYRIVRPDNSIRWILDRSFPIKNSAGEIYRRVGVSQDITERKRVEEVGLYLEKEREMSELKLRFFSMASHELRTPLSTILLSAQSLKSSGGRWGEEKTFKNLNRIEMSAKTMTQLLTDILTLTRAEAGKLDFHPELLNLTEFCLVLIEQVEVSLLVNQRVFFVSEWCGGEAWVDEKLLRSILTNLLSNAIKYSGEGSSIYLTLRREGEMAIFQIRDQGIGILLEDRQFLYDSFHRGENVGDIPGTGLGLAVVKKCVELHGGRISVESEVGVGSLFTVWLPCRRCG
ncbi:CHASE3 domain-containing protein [Ancylothrix sp. C2]|uniref:CHASE3 domain-containing protein n=1 Tax=Ancylothrix sp. D3o TaxID=2953691 RepID=UPI0021BBA593|nr:CHASE3 domain-containing protein [Ancylothrix sp. D3o]MCT7949478.1 CHASE3 domain-containing protein [Ancylothrix sp. D3o]